MQDSKLAYNITDFCQVSGLGRTSLYQEIKSGRLKARKCGKRTIITEEDGRAWLNSLPPVETETK